MISEVITGIVFVILFLGFGLGLIRSINKGKYRSCSRQPYQLLNSSCPWNDKRR